jgi:hypothetical protein
LLSIMKEKPIVVAGGYIRACIAREDINDIDCFEVFPLPTGVSCVFATCKEFSEQRRTSALASANLINGLVADKRKIIETDNAVTVLLKPPVQFIHRWDYSRPEDVCESFDFTICSAALWYDVASKSWKSCCHDQFYDDLASKRLQYMAPFRDEEPGGSLLRVLKYYAKGYRITLPSFASVIDRLCSKIDWEKAGSSDDWLQTVILGLLREVDPSIDIHVYDAAVPAGEVMAAAEEEAA